VRDVDDAVLSKVNKNDTCINIHYIDHIHDEQKYSIHPEKTYPLYSVPMEEY